MPSVHLNVDSCFGHMFLALMELENPTPCSQKPQINPISATTRYIKFLVYTICISDYSFIVLHSCDYPWNLKTFPTAVGKTCCYSLYINYDQWDSRSRVLSTLLTHD